MHSNLYGAAVFMNKQQRSTFEPLVYDINLWADYWEREGRDSSQAEEPNSIQ